MIQKQTTMPFVSCENQNETHMYIQHKNCKTKSLEYAPTKKQDINICEINISNSIEKTQTHPPLFPQE